MLEELWIAVPTATPIATEKILLLCAAGHFLEFSSTRIGQVCWLAMVNLIGMLASIFRAYLECSQPVYLIGFVKYSLVMYTAIIIANRPSSAICIHWISIYNSQLYHPWRGDCYTQGFTAPPLAIKNRCCMGFFVQRPGLYSYHRSRP